MKLPNRAKAVIPEGKLEDYCLNPFHPDGKHKAKIFEKSIGVTIENSAKLRDLILQSAEFGELTKDEKINFGRIYRVELEVEGLKQKEILCTLWIIHKGDDVPFLTSCYVKTKEGKKDDTSS